MSLLGSEERPVKACVPARLLLLGLSLLGLSLLGLSLLGLLCCIGYRCIITIKDGNKRVTNYHIEFLEIVPTQPLPKAAVQVPPASVSYGAKGFSAHHGSEALGPALVEPSSRCLTL